MSVRILELVAFLTLSGLSFENGISNDLETLFLNNTIDAK